jgi:hypothetical protein
MNQRTMAAFTFILVILLCIPSVLAFDLGLTKVTEDVNLSANSYTDYFFLKSSGHDLSLSVTCDDTVDIYILNQNAFLNISYSSPESDLSRVCEKKWTGSKTYSEKWSGGVDGESYHIVIYNPNSKAVTGKLTYDPMGGAVDDIASTGLTVLGFGLLGSVICCGVAILFFVLIVIVIIAIIVKLVKRKKK